MPLLTWQLCQLVQTQDTAHGHKLRFLNHVGAQGRRALTTTGVVHLHEHSAYDRAKYICTYIRRLH